MVTLPYPVHFGFRQGDCGTHTCRTMMFDELSVLLKVVPPGAPRAAFSAAIIDDNVLGKSTSSARKLTAQRLAELYGLDPRVTLYRVLRQLWDMTPDACPQLALLCALARDPLLRITAPAVLALNGGEELSRQRLLDALRDAAGGRLNDSTLDKVARNASSSWLQSGHLLGRVRKLRQRVRPKPATVAFALLLGYLQGLRGSRLLSTEWTRIFDATTTELLDSALEAKKLGCLDLKMAGEVLEFGFAPFLTLDELRGIHVAS